ncbi:hypothetical protein DPMN_024122 [Dreissena polymorpha]|uniref:Uncharacterized protein n=1 Tax=Dreissena polymorpha TaxID=45954 RepID=A0A9D4RCE6_DREPO|nr:hypothetical protein DPMN_024122 [Dreissena polymorpha]
MLYVWQFGALPDGIVLKTLSHNRSETSGKSFKGVTVWHSGQGPTLKLAPKLRRKKSQRPAA